jgi:hypothetical protein
MGNDRNFNAGGAARAIAARRLKALSADIEASMEFSDGEQPTGGENGGDDV